MTSRIVVIGEWCSKHAWMVLAVKVMILSDFLWGGRKCFLTWHMSNSSVHSTHLMHLAWTTSGVETFTAGKLQWFRTYAGRGPAFSKGLLSDRKAGRENQKRRSAASGNFGYPLGRSCSSNAQSRARNFDLCLPVPALMNLVQHYIAKGVWEILWLSCEVSTCM